MTGEASPLPHREPPEANGYDDYDRDRDALVDRDES